MLLFVLRCALVVAIFAALSAFEHALEERYLAQFWL